MLQFLILGILAIFFAYQSQFKGKKNMLIFSFVIITYVMGMQDAISVDFNNYKGIFYDILGGKIDHSYLGFGTKDGFDGIESGWYFLNLFIGHTIGYYNVVATIASAIISFALYKIILLCDSRYRWLAVTYFYFIPMLFFMSAIRQGVAVGIFILVVIYIIEKSWKKAAIFVLLGFSFHNSFIFSLAFIPLLFIPDKFLDKYKKTTTILLLMTYSLTVLFSSQINEYAITLATSNLGEGMSSYEGYFEDAARAELSTIYIIFRYILFCISLFAFWNSNRSIRKILLLYILSSYTIAVLGENNNIARLNYYISIFAVPCMCTIPSLLKNKMLRYAFLLLISYYIFNNFTKALDTTHYGRFKEYETIIF